MESKSTPSPSPKTKIDQFIDGLFAYLQRRWQLLALVILYIFFRPTFESKLVALLQSFEPSWGSFIVWCGIIVTALAYTYILCRRRYVISEGVRSWTVVLLVGWVYYRFIGVEDYVATPTRIPGICYVDFLPFCWGCMTFVVWWSHRHRTKPKQEGVNNSIRGFEVECPCTYKDNDLLGRRNEAQDLAEKIFQTDTSNAAFTLGLTAPWGAGKTSFMLAMQKYLRDKHCSEILLIDFNPWMYRKAPNLTQIFFEELSRALAPYSSALASGFMQYVDYILSKENNTWIQLGARLLPQGFKAKSTSEQYKLLEKEIGKLRRKIVIFIDDVDRLDGEELTELFSLVRNISSFSNMSYILAYDKKYVLLQLEKKGLNKELAVNYMEKIMQVEFPLAEITSEQIEKAFSDVLEQSAEEYPNLKEAIRSSNIELRSHLPTLRSIKQIQNILSSFPQKLKGNVIPFDWFIIELIRTQYPLLFSFLKENYTLIFDDRGDGKLFIKTQEDETGQIDLPAKIKELIPINKSEQVLELMMPLWGEDRGNDHGQANNWEYIGIYFYRVLDNNDIRMAELKQYLAKQASELPQSLENFKSYVDKMLNSYRWLTFCDLVYEQYGNSLNEVVNILCLAFYMLSREERRWLQNVSEQIDKCIDSIREYEGEEAQKQRLKELFDYSDIRKGVLLYISSILNRAEEVRIPFSSDELEAIKEKLFLEYTQDDTSIDPIDCYRLWFKCQTYRRVELDGSHSWQIDPVTSSSKMNTRMREIIEKNIVQLIPYFVQEPLIKAPLGKAYRLLLPYPIWTLAREEETNEIKYFPKFIFELDASSSNIIKEFQEFLAVWLERIDILEKYLTTPGGDAFYNDLSQMDQYRIMDLREHQPERLQGLENNPPKFFQLLRNRDTYELGFIRFNFKSIIPQDI